MFETTTVGRPNYEVRFKLQPAKCHFSGSSESTFKLRTRWNVFLNFARGRWGNGGEEGDGGEGDDGGRWREMEGVVGKGEKQRGEGWRRERRWRGGEGERGRRIEGETGEGRVCVGRGEGRLWRRG